ncbi:hypothetical protein RRF57_007932 [Xylaria bambusicola]|uniref:Ketoreductase (KR) domain-containing protein n=1 Tax=Xylaria bambusicola TaxID=326684 RepID=A0AAN7ULW7_9PEZI
MSFDSLLKVIGPKALGSSHMDEIFQSRDRDLEFFIFSSGGYILINPGQGNYAAANLLMTVLAERRRR